MALSPSRDPWISSTGLQLCDSRITCRRRIADADCKILNRSSHAKLCEKHRRRIVTFSTHGPHQGVEIIGSLPCCEKLLLKIDRALPCFEKLLLKVIRHLLRIKEFLLQISGPGKAIADVPRALQIAVATEATDRALAGTFRLLLLALNASTLDRLRLFAA